MEAEGKLPLLKACETDLTTVPVVRPEGPDYTCYKRRWYILFVFLLTSMMSNALWNTWPPIQATCQLVFGWTNQNTLIIGAISSIASLVFIVPSSWVLNNMGKLSRSDLRALTDHSAIIPCFINNMKPSQFYKIQF